eukprot:GHVU01040410.1.p1 GENE.GHVU01040410.1~~GHVU01040410.1.p1  ORF type:complete len:207 (+),score=46.51 GHVU01040410.1:96-716(+)
MFTKTIAAAILAFATINVAVATNTITFVNQDSIDRTVVFTSNAGIAELEDFTLPGGEQVTKNIPADWCGNVYTADASIKNSMPGMLAEFCFNGWGGMVFFDISAIVNPGDHDNVKEIFPIGDEDKMAGCQDYTTPCLNAYNVFDDDKATHASKTSDFIALIGNLPEESSSTSSRRAGAAKKAAPAVKQVGTMAQMRGSAIVVPAKQ